MQLELLAQQARLVRQAHKAQLGPQVPLAQPVRLGPLARRVCKVPQELLAQPGRLEQQGQPAHRAQQD